MAVIKAIRNGGNLKQLYNYVTKEEKTEADLMSGIYCDPDTALEQMMATKEVWNKTDGRQYKHFMQSYHKDEHITLEQAHKNAVDLANGTEAWKGYEVLIATHKDKDHIHTHFIVNSVSIEDGYKLRWSKADLQDLKDRCNEQSREQGLHVPEKGKTFDGQDRTDEVTAWDKDKYHVLNRAMEDNPKIQSYIMDTAMAVMDCRETATSREDFIEKMRERGYDTNWTDNRKYITFTDLARQEAGESKCKVRNSNLEKTFNLDFGKEELERGFAENARTTEAERAAAEQIRKFSNDNSATDDTDQGPTGRDHPVKVPDRAAEEADRTAEILRDIRAAETSRASAELARRDKEFKRKARDDERKRLDREEKRRAAERKQSSYHRKQSSKSKGFER